MRVSGRFKALAAMAAVVSMSAAGAFAQSANTAYVPFVVNANATVTAVQGAEVVSMTVTANEESVLILSRGTISVLNPGGTRERLNAPMVTGSRGNITLRLPPQSYQNAEIALHSVNGKRVLRAKAAASEAASAISRRNVAPGVYMLSVKGLSGNTFTTRLTHGGGNLNISVAFGAESVSPERRLEKQAADGDWGITVAADGYITYTYTLRPVVGINERQVITLDPAPQSGNTFVDSRDGKTYKRVTIGTQVWMGQNLNYDVPNNTTDVCYIYSADSCAKYGRMYNWETAMGGASSSNLSPSGVQGICPAGWHLPSDAEWTTLTTYVGTGSYVGANSGTKLKSSTGWNRYSGIPAGTDNYGFSALPGGYGGNGGSQDAGNYGTWWSATEGDAYYARYRLMYYRSEDVSRDYDDKRDLFSVRCVQDAVVQPPTTAYTITFNQNYTGAPTATTAKTGTDGKLASLPTPTRTGYTFKGWWTVSAATGGTQVTTSTTFSADAAVYARWEEAAVQPVTYTITFNQNYTGAPTATTAKTGTDGKLASLPTPTRTGYTFKGWWTVSAATGGTQVTTGTTFSADAAVYARWEETAVQPVTYTITFNVNGGSGSRPEISTYAGTSITIPDGSGLSKSGYNFDRWSTGRTGGGSNDHSYYAGGSYTPTSSITLYAIWAGVPTPETKTTFTDARDGQTYKKVKINNQWWMAENLNYDVPNNTSDVCYNNSMDSCAKYGRLYNWATAMGIDESYNTTTWSGRDVKRHQGVCPAGWHLSSDNELTTLIDFAGGANTAGTKLKSSNYWRSYNDIPAGTDEYGFSALPGGYGYGNGKFGAVGDYGRWWNTWERNESEALSRLMLNHDEDAHRFAFDKVDLLSVRCVQDE